MKGLFVLIKILVFITYGVFETVDFHSSSCTVSFGCCYMVNYEISFSFLSDDLVYFQYYRKLHFT